MLFLQIFWLSWMQRVVILGYSSYIGWALSRSFTNTVGFAHQICSSWFLYHFVWHLIWIVGDRFILVSQVLVFVYQVPKSHQTRSFTESYDQILSIQAPIKPRESLSIRIGPNASSWPPFKLGEAADSSSLPLELSSRGVGLHPLGHKEGILLFLTLDTV